MPGDARQVRRAGSQYRQGRGRRGDSQRRADARGRTVAVKVMKFGGTSVADQPAIERLIALVRAERQAEAQKEGGDARGPVVVVSALSGVTDRLLGVAALARSGDVEGAHTSLQDLRARHIKVSEVIRDQSLRQPVVDALNREFDELERVVSALAVLQEVSPRWMDALAATGEILSSQIVAAALTSHKLLATYEIGRASCRERV